MKEYQYAVVRCGGSHNGEILWIGDSIQECYEQRSKFKSDGIGCRVLSYDEIKKQDAAMAALHKIRL